MEQTDFSTVLLALAFVVALMWGAATVVKKLGLDKKIRGVRSGPGRLQTLETLYLDPKRKLTLVRADDREYLLLIAGDNATLVDTFKGQPHA